MNFCEPKFIIPLIVAYIFSTLLRDFATMGLAIYGLHFPTDIEFFIVVSRKETSFRLELKGHETFVCRKEDLKLAQIEI